MTVAPAILAILADESLSMEERVEKVLREGEKLQQAQNIVDIVDSVGLLLATKVQNVLRASTRADLEALLTKLGIPYAWDENEGLIIKPTVTVSVPAPAEYICLTTTIVQAEPLERRYLPLPRPRTKTEQPRSVVIDFDTSSFAAYCTSYATWVDNRINEAFHVTHEQLFPKEDEMGEARRARRDQEWRTGILSSTLYSAEEKAELILAGRPVIPPAGPRIVAQMDVSSERLKQQARFEKERQEEIEKAIQQNKPVMIGDF